jgi:hypothetical protein
VCHFLAFFADRCSHSVWRLPDGFCYVKRARRCRATSLSDVCLGHRFVGGDLNVKFLWCSEAVPTLRSRIQVVGNAARAIRAAAHARLFPPLCCVLSLAAISAIDPWDNASLDYDSSVVGSWN